MAKHWFGMVGRKSLLYVGIGIFLVCFTGSLIPALGQEGNGSAENNRIVSLAVGSHSVPPTVTIKTDTPVGYRYTVYESSNPDRVVIDFPGMVVKDVPPLINVDSPLLKTVRTSSLNLPSGKLGRVEVLLAKPANYKVSLTKKVFLISFAEKTSTVKGSTQKAPPAGAGAAAKSAVPTPAASAAAPLSVVKTTSAHRIESVDIEKGRAAIVADGRIGKYHYFKLGAPPRLVMDIFGVRPEFEQQSFKISSGFKGIRIGTYKNKTRLVFDGKGVTLPPFTVEQKDSRLLVSWGKGVSAKPSKAAVDMHEPVTVEGVDFKIVKGKSLITITLSGKGKVLPATRKDDTVRFGVRNALIGRAQRRTIDASAFPSAVRLVTPYTTSEKGVQDVRFAVQLKGPVSYSLKQEDRRLILGVENGPFAEAKPPQVEKVPLPAPSPPSMAKPQKPAKAVSAVPGVAATPVVAKAASSPVISEAPEEPQKYTGQKITLVFDNADIRKILQLIGDVSGLNIIAGEDVKGTITLRLVDVPWDQALNLIMETKGLGMLREGNVVRILPLEQIRKRRKAELSAKKEEKDLEPLVTKVIAVSYTDLGNVAGPAKELLSSRGKITQDSRNKQIIVTDVPSVIQQITKLVKILDTPEKQVMIEARIVEASSSFTRNLGVNWGLNYTNPGGGPWAPSTAGIGLGGQFLIAPPTAGALSGIAGLGSGITFGRVGIDSTILDLQLSALESSGEGKIISSPRVSTVNGGEATISQGTKIPYQSSGSNGLPKTEFVDANLSLKVTPVINPDKSIILDIDATNSSVGADVPVGTGSAPSVDTKEAKTKLLVRDGETTVIGGIYVENDSNSEVGVPILGHIPILGHLFKSTTKTKTRSELLIFITPRIVGE